MMKKLVIGCMGVLAGLTALADAKWYAGDGCLNNLDLWTGGSPVHTAEQSGPWVYFFKSTAGAMAYTVTLNADMRWNALFQNQQNLEVTMDLAPYTLYLNFGDAIRLQSNGSTLRLKSGTLSSLQLSSGYGAINYWDNAQDVTFIADGESAVVDAPINMRGGYGCTCIITNGAKVLRGAQIHGYSNNKLIISGEGTEVYYLNDQFNVGGWHKQGDVMAGAAQVTNNYALVNDGAQLKNVGDVFVGFYGSFCTLEVDNATINANYLTIGQTSYSSNNTLRVKNGGKILLGGDKYVKLAAHANNDLGSCNNLVEFDNADLSALKGFNIGSQADWEPEYGRGCHNNLLRMKNQYWELPNDSKFNIMGGSSNGVEITDSSLVITHAGMLIGYGNHSHNAFLRITNNSVVSNFNENVGTQIGGRNGNHVLMEVTGGAKYWMAKGCTLGFPDASRSYGAILRVSDGAEFITEESICAGRLMSNGGAASSNRIEVLSGATVTAERVRFFGLGNELLVSNATLRVKSEFRSSYHDTEDGGANTIFTFAGTTPRIVMEGLYNGFQRAAHFNFIVPAGGYQTIPFESTATQNINIKGGCTLSADVEAWRKTGGGKCILMKAQSGYGFSFEAGQLELLQSNLENGVRLYLSDDEATLSPSTTGNLLVLKCSPRSSIIYIR